MAVEPKVCIGIPFTVWNKLVEESVRGCLALDYTNFVVVLVPNAGVEVPHEFLQDPRVIVVFTETSGIAQKRNKAISVCDGDFYACIDSDAYPERDWLKNAVRVFQGSEDIWAVGGPNLSPEYQSVKRRAPASALKSFFVAGPRVFAKRRSPDRFVNDLQTCNLVLKKEALDQVGIFNEDLATGEDTDLCERIVRTGRKIYFSRDVVVYHHNRSLWLPFIKQKIVFGYAVIPILKRGFSISKLFFFLPFAFILWAMLGWLTIFLSEALFWFWALGMAFYFLGALVEAARWSQKFRDIPFTFLALIIGNAGPGVGTLINLFGIKINFSKFYKNYDG